MCLLGGGWRSFARRRLAWRPDKALLDGAENASAVFAIHFAEDEGTGGLGHGTVAGVEKPAIEARGEVEEEGMVEAG